jgi:hypothetical protein
LEVNSTDIILSDLPVTCGSGVTSANAWAMCIYNIGLIALPCWDGGKALPGTHHRQLADNPPVREIVGQKDYSGGLSILLGTRHPAGGYITGCDIDQGPFSLKSLPSDCLMAEMGTAPGKWHLYVRTINRLQGQTNLRDKSGRLVAEVKGYGLSLRSWPTRPFGKPRGYRVIFLARPPFETLPTITTGQLTEWVRDLIFDALKNPIEIERHLFDSKVNPSMTSFSAGLARQIKDELENRGVNLRPSGKDGWLSGRCPFHQDRRPSFSVSFELGAWKCWSGCGSGGMYSLADRLGLTLNRSIHYPCSITSWEVRG